MTVMVFDNFLHGQTIGNINSYWNDAARAKTFEGDMSDGDTRDIMKADWQELASLFTQNELDGYNIRGGFMIKANKPLQVHCVKRDASSCQSALLVINIMAAPQLQPNQALITFQQTVKNERIILVDEGTDQGLLDIYNQFGFTPVTQSEMDTHINNVRTTPDMTDEVKTVRCTHVSQETLPYLDVDEVLVHKYNRAMLMPIETLHCSSTAAGDVERIVFFVDEKSV
mgnify:FL=1